MARIARAKVLIVGDSEVGKTSLLHRFVDDKFPFRPMATMGSDFRKRTIEIEDSMMQLEVWDTAGQERYMSVASGFFRGSNGVLLVFDVTNVTSFTGIQKWVEEVEYHEIPIWKCLLVGNKIDLINERFIDYSLASSLAHRLGLSYIETSVKEDKNVQLAFATLAKQMIEQMKVNAFNQVRSISVFNLLEYDRSNRKKRGCRKWNCSIM